MYKCTSASPWNCDYLRHLHERLRQVTYSLDELDVKRTFQFNNFPHINNSIFRMSKNILIVGATRGLGASLRALYDSNPSTHHVFATTRSDKKPDSQARVSWLQNIDLTKPDVGDKLVSQLPSSTKLATVIISAGYFGLESFETPDWDKQVQMYTTSAIAPVFVVQRLAKSGFLGDGSKVILVSSESGSITLRHEKEGGGNYGHHASKTALNMVGKLLSLDLKPSGVAVGLVHPGFMRTGMTKGVGFDKYWDAGGGEFVTLFIYDSSDAVSV